MVRLLSLSDCFSYDEGRLTNPEGIHSFYCPKGVAPLVDVFFIHGLGGKSEQSWSRHKTLKFFWPRWLRKELGLERARLSTFGYPSKIAPTLSKDYTNIRDFAAGFLFQVTNYANEGNNEVPMGQVRLIWYTFSTRLSIFSTILIFIWILKLPVIFVAHSMGGLIVKEVCPTYWVCNWLRLRGIDECPDNLVQICNQARQDPNYKTFVSSICAILFFGTPHRGSELADTFDNILEAACLRYFQKSYISELRLNSPTLANIEAEFLSTPRNFKIISFYENRGLGPTGQVS